MSIKLLAAVLFASLTTAAAAAAAAEPVLCPGNLWYPGGVCPSTAPIAQPQPPPLDPAREVYFNSVQSSGDVHLERAGGGSLSEQNMAQVRLSSGDQVVTGPSGHVVLELTDGSIVELGSNSNLDFETVKFWSEPEPFIARLVFGIAHYTHTTKWLYPEPTLKVASAAVGIRGTELEMDAEPDGSGYVKLISGSIEITPDDGGEPFMVSPGETVRFSNFAIVH